MSRKTIPTLAIDVTAAIQRDEVTTGQLLSLAHALICEAANYERAFARDLAGPIPGGTDFPAILTARADDLDIAAAHVRAALAPIDL